MKKVSYEAWAVVSVGAKVKSSSFDGRPFLFATKKQAKQYSFLAAGIQKVRVTIEPVKAKKKRKVAR